MLAKLTSKNQLTLPKNVVQEVPATYYAVRTEGASIVLTPVRIGGLELVQQKLAALGIREKDVSDAVAWARARGTQAVTAPDAVPARKRAVSKSSASPKSTARHAKSR